MIIIFHSLDRTNIGPQVELSKETIYGPVMAISKIMELDFSNSALTKQKSKCDSQLDP